MRDPHLPTFLFSCHACGAAIPEPERGVGEPIAKGGGFSSMKLFCTRQCADGTAVEAALLMMDEASGATEDEDEDAAEDEDEDEDEPAG